MEARRKSWNRHNVFFHLASGRRGGELLVLTPELPRLLSELAPLLPPATFGASDEIALRYQADPGSLRQHA